MQGRLLGFTPQGSLKSQLKSQRYMRHQDQLLDELNEVEQEKQDLMIHWVQRILHVLPPFRLPCVVYDAIDPALFLFPVILWFEFSYIVHIVLKGMKGQEMIPKSKVSY